MAIVAGACAATNNLAAPGWLMQPLSLPEAIRMAVAQNAGIVKSLHDLEIAHGVAIQTRAVVLPKLRGAGGYVHNEAVEKSPFSGFEEPRDSWSGSIRLVQTIYQGGRLLSSLRTARLVREQAFLDYKTIVANTLLDVRTAYYDVLLAEQEIVVRDASVKLLEQQLEKTKHQFDVGAVPRFDVLRGEVEIANARPKLIRAKNVYRNAKNDLATLLAYNIPSNVLEDIPLTLTTKLDLEPYEIELPRAVALARTQRPELGALRAEVRLHKERVIAAKSGYKPTIDVFAGYGARNSDFQDDFFRDVSGAMAGVALSWDFFDGLQTQGRIVESRAREAKAVVSLEDAARRIEQQVRTAYSSFLEAREVLESQKKVQERAEEALRLSQSRYEAGSGTQLDVLNAQTALTEARTTQIEAARDYLVARARLDQAIGLDVSQEQAGNARKPGELQP